ncbi:unnamed protein product [Lactuca virosa]|uniref:Uncharacterized protein n=1 Tax=Lactuca virosa TaxID=75947 RepID=A0AAU9NJ82_9ASTR|nr:unnamed protein product [Lactuca virosa]
MMAKGGRNNAETVESDHEQRQKNKKKGEEDGGKMATHTPGNHAVDYPRPEIKLLRSVARLVGKARPNGDCDWGAHTWRLRCSPEVGFASSNHDVGKSQWRSIGTVASGSRACHHRQWGGGWEREV